MLSPEKVLLFQVQTPQTRSADCAIWRGKKLYLLREYGLNLKILDLPIESTINIFNQNSLTNHMRLRISGYKIDLYDLSRRRKMKIMNNDYKMYANKRTNDFYGYDQEINI